MNGKKKEVSGWYAKSELTAAERSKTDEWFKKMIDLNYRTLPVEIPGKMLLELGKLAKQKNMAFNDFIEQILGEYLDKQGISWKTMAVE